MPARGVHAHQSHGTCHVCHDVQAGGVVPPQRMHRNRRRRSEVARLAAARIHQIQIAARRAEVAHDTPDDRDTRSVGRPSGIVDLIPWRKQIAHLTRSNVDSREPRYPPVVVAVADGIGCSDRSTVRRPSVLVNVAIGRRDHPHGSRPGVHDCEALFVNDASYHAHVTRSNLQSAGLPMRLTNVENGERVARGRPRQVRNVPVEFAELAHV